MYAVTTNSISVRCRVASFIAALCVVMIHSNALSAIETPASWNLIMHSFFCRQSWAVPFFFCVSGYWFAGGRYIASEMTYREFICNKVRGLLVPYFFFAVLAIFAVSPMVVMNNLLTHKELLSRTVFVQGSLWQMIDSALGIGQEAPFCLGPLWYVRTLFLIFILAPVWRLIYRKAPWIFLIAFVLLRAIVPCGMIPYPVSIQYGLAGFFLLGMIIKK